MTQGLNRYYGLGHLHFITFSCYHRLPMLNNDFARTLFLVELARVRREYQFALVGYVVMPEHVHLLLSEPKRGTPSTVPKMLKLRVSHKMHKKQRSLSSPDSTKSLTQFWQARFYDFNVYTDKKKREKLDYMHSNPVRRKLVQLPQDWPWSSYSFYEKGEPGPIAIDPV
jgi:putative transposase